MHEQYILNRKCISFGNKVYYYEIVGAVAGLWEAICGRPHGEKISVPLDNQAAVRDLTTGNSILTSRWIRNYKRVRNEFGSEVRWMPALCKISKNEVNTKARRATVTSQAASTTRIHFSRILASSFAIVLSILSQ